uniref:START domain-containing protein 10 n=1 Tax=Sander lucioperca TaxID=283035 RepID=A0A8D0AX05_SANLU
FLLKIHSKMSILPDEADFADFRKQCLSTDNWFSKYDKNGMQVLVEASPTNKGNPVPKCKMTINDVSAATMYDVLHDGQYRKTWDPAMLDSFDIARLSANADVGYYSWICPQPIKNRDVVTLRSWQVTEDEYIIFNFSVKHLKYPPRKDLVRAISILTGYLIKPTGPNSCTFIYLSQADPKGKTITNAHPSLFKMRIAGQMYPEWKRQNSPDRKPWLYPEQNILPMMDPSELSIQRADSLENMDESSKVHRSNCHSPQSKLN